MSTNIDIGQILEALNTKADMDLGNSINYLTTAAKSYFAGIGMPSDRYINLTLNASGSTYTALANGYFFLTRTGAGTGSYMNIVNSSTKIGTESYAQATNNYVMVWLPVKSGDTVTVSYSANYTTTVYFRFIYAVGSESEAS